MRIDVTAEDIQSGQRCDINCCPVGRALRRAGVPHEAVMGGALLVEAPGGRLDFRLLPREVGNWLLEFDRGRPVQPMSFELPGAAEDFPSLAA